jgi:hypothetical protein
MSDHTIDELWGEAPVPPMRPAETSPAAGEPASGPAAGRVLALSFFDDAFATTPRELPERVDAFERRCNDATTSGLEDVAADNDAKKRGLAFSPCRYKPGTKRNKANVEAVSCFVIDLDDVDGADVVLDRLASLGVRAWAWSTWGSGWTKRPQAWRVVVPLACDVDAEDWPAAWQGLTSAFAPEIDTSTKDASRLHFMPRAPLTVPDGEGGTRENDPIGWRSLDGALLDPRPFIITHETADRAAITPPAARSVGSVGHVATTHGASGNRPDRVERARRYLERAEVSVSGDGGHAVAMRVVGAVVRGFDLTEGEAREVLGASGWNARCQPPWSEPELDHKIREARATPDPQGRQPGWLFREERERPSEHDVRAPVDLDRLILGEATNDDVDPEAVTWLSEVKAARADLEVAMGTSASYLAKPCDFDSYGDLMVKNIPSLSWLVRGLVTDGAVAMLSGEPKTAKTWLAIELAVAVALGDKALGEFQTRGEPRAVALFLTEDNEANVRARLRGTVIGHGGDPPDNPPIFVKARGTLNLGDVHTLAWLVASVRRLPSAPALVVIDPLRNVMGALKESDNDDAAKVNAALRALRDVLGATVLYVHHAAKLTEATAGRSGGQRARGASALHGGYDAGIHLSAPGVMQADDLTTRTATVEAEVKAGKGAGSFAFELRIHDNDGGQCVRADWTFQRETRAAQGTANLEAQTERAILAAFCEPGAFAKLRCGADGAPVQLSRDALAKAAGGKKERTLAVIDRLIDERRLASRKVGKATHVWVQRGEDSDRDPHRSPVPSVEGGNGNDVPRTKGNDGNDDKEGARSSFQERPGTNGNDVQRDDPVARKVLATLSEPGAPLELSTAALARLTICKRMEVDDAVKRLADSGALSMRMTPKGERLVRLPSTDSTIPAIDEAATEAAS